MKPFYLLLVFSILSTTLMFGQSVRKADVRGTMIDQEETPLSGATVMLLAAKDSVLVGFASTDGNGIFRLKNVNAGLYLLKLSYVGFATYTQQLEVGEEPEMDLGQLIMAPAAEVLSEVEVTADFVPIKFKKDTIEYNADAFQTQPNAVVEDLLKKLPGVEVATDGSIKAQGEDVQNVFVDGKEFFGTDPKVATKNLPAKAVKNVKVYDKLSDMAEFSGIDDGQREKTINLELREDFKTGLFGTAEAGYGSDDRYMAKTNINKFTKKSQLSVLGLLNNVNEQGFSFEEYVNFSGGMRAFGGGGRVRMNSGEVPISQGIGDGLTKTLAGGLNYNFEVGKKLDIRSSYFANTVDKNLLENTFRQNFLNGSTYETIEDNDSDTENFSHRLNLRTKFKIDSTQNLELVGSASVGGGDSRSQQLQETFNSEQLIENTGMVSNLRNTDRINVSGDLYYRKRLAKKGRNMSLNLSVDSRDDDGETRLMAINEYLTTGNTELLDQLQTTVGDNMEWGGEVSYTEPILKNQYLEFGYEYSNNSENSFRDAADIDSFGNQVPNPGLTTRFQRDLSIHRPGVTWRLNTERSSLSAGVEMHMAHLDGVVNDGEIPVALESNYVLPSLRWRYDIATARNLRVDYRTSVNMPSVSELSPVVDNSDPLKVYVGNPDLEPEYVHRANINFHSFSQFSFTSIFASLTGTLTKDKIVNGTTIDQQFIETTSPVNISDEYQLRLYASFGTPLKFIKSRIQLNANVQYTNSVVPINAVNNNLDRWTRSFGVRFQNQNSDVLEYSVGGNWTQSTTQYSESTRNNQDFFTHQYSGNITVNFLKTWSANTSMDVALYTGDQFDENQTLPIWKASVSKYVMEGRRGQIRVSVFDLLDKNKGLSRNSSANYIEEVRANSIGRYGMVSFLYSIRGFNKNSGGMGGMRMFRH